jgi:maleate isomerase
MTSRVGLLMPPMPTAPELDSYMAWRVGLLVPSPNSVMEVDFYRSLPHDTTLHTGRMYMPDFMPASIELMLDHHVLPAAEALGTVMPHIVVFGSTSGYRVRGKAFDSELCGRVAKATGAEAVSVAESVSQALRDTRATRIAVVTPYTDEVNRRISSDLEAEGFIVSELHGMGLPSTNVAAITPESIYSFVQTRIGPSINADALYLGSTNCHAMSAMSLLKVAYDVPIVTANFATLQAVKRRLHALRDRGFAAGAARG